MPPKDAPQIAIPAPPLIYLIPLAIGISIDWFFPAPLMPGRIQYFIAIALALPGAMAMPLVLSEFRRARTHFDPRKPATSIVADGPYRYSRNPAYLSLAFVYLAVTAAVDSAWLLAGFLPAFLMTHYGVILPEERYLEHKFGDRYRGYKAAVRRYF
jgi:protein-S-isoprenylcysteine O-methyltransferase Ste14